MPGGWGDHEWGSEPWGGTVVISPSIGALFLLAEEDPPEAQLGPYNELKATRPLAAMDLAGHELCPYFPEFMCHEDTNPEVGGTGDWHRLLALFYGFLYGIETVTGYFDDIASFRLLSDIENVPDNFLDAWLLRLGFNLAIPLTDEEKRRVLPALVPLYKGKGSRQGIQAALRVLLGIPVEILDFRSPGYNFFECGQEDSTSLSSVDSTSTFVEVDYPERFEVGKRLTIVDTSGGNVAWPLPKPLITGIVANRIIFAAQVLGGTIPAGARVYCNKFNSHLDDGSGDYGESKLGPDFFDAEDPSIYTFAVDVQRTVATVSEINDGDSQVELSDVSFITVGRRVRITDLIAPIQGVVEVKVLTKDEDTNIITFDPLALEDTIEAGAEAINLFSAEEIATIEDVVEFAKPSHTHHVITRDRATAPVTIG